MPEEKKFILKPTVSPSEKEFINKVGTDVWDTLKSKTLREDGFKCQGCGFEPYDSNIEGVIDAHLVESDLENPENSKTRTVCSFCHLIEHADVAINRGDVEIVNSFHSQGDLVNICRNNQAAYHIELGEIRYLKRDITDFLNDLKSGISLEGKVKFIFTEKFLKSKKII